jgi:hypothetical protein
MTYRIIKIYNIGYSRIEKGSDGLFHVYNETSNKEICITKNWLEAYGTAKGNNDRLNIIQKNMRW